MYMYMHIRPLRNAIDVFENHGFFYQSIMIYYRLLLDLLDYYRFIIDYYRLCVAKTISYFRLLSNMRTKT